MLAIVASGGGLLFGYDIGVVSGALKQLKIQFQLSCHEQEMVVSSMLFGALFGSMFGGFLIDKCGRKLSIIISSVLYILGGIFLAAAQSYSVIIVGRVILGLGMALAAASECVYVSELAPKKIRGSLVSLNEFGITVGILGSYVINVAFASDEENGWRYMFGLSTAAACLVLVCVLFLPKSPRYLLINSKNQIAKSCLYSIRIHNTNREAFSVEEEFQLMARSITAENTISLNLCNRSLFYSVAISLALVLFQQLSGEPNILVYANTILESVGFHNDVVASLGAVGLGVSKVVATIFCLFFIDKFGRKKFLFSGCILMAVSLFALSLTIFHYDFDNKNLCKDNESYQESSIQLNVTSPFPTTVLFSKNSVSKWFVMIFLMLYVAAYSLSFGPVTWIILSEVFPRSLRGRLFSIATCFNWLINLLISSTFLDFVKLTEGLGWPFMINAFVCVISILFIFVVIPETKGKSLEEINVILSRGIQWKKQFLLCIRHDSYNVIPLNELE